jgi:hypothetical protein
MEDKNKIFIINQMNYITMNPTSATMEYIIKSAIYENKMELITPSREYTDKEVAYIKGYIQSLEDMLEEFTLLNKEDLLSTYKICLN